MELYNAISPFYKMSLWASSTKRRFNTKGKEVTDSLQLCLTTAAVTDTLLKRRKHTISLLPQNKCCLQRQCEMLTAPCQSVLMSPLTEGVTYPVLPLCRCSVSQIIINSKQETWLVTYAVSVPSSNAVSREPPRLGHEGRFKRKEAAQGGGELHMEHHHSEGEKSVLPLTVCLSLFTGYSRSLLFPHLQYNIFF